MRLALRLRETGRDAVIINADSAQVYADLRVLSARPMPAEMRDVPHRLFGAWDGAIACSAADWAAAARAEIAQAQVRGIVPIVVGGTGLYIRTLLDGIAPIPEIDPAVRATVRGLTVEVAYAALSRKDPDGAARLAPGDTARVCRALEVVRSTGRSIAAWQAERAGGIAQSVILHPLVLTPEREVLYQRCAIRFAAMLDNGAIPEVEALLARALSPALPVMRAIGVREIAGHLGGAWPLTEALARAVQATRQYAKRQATWFRGQTPAVWPAADPSEGGHQILDTLFHDLSLT